MKTLTIKKETVFEVNASNDYVVVNQSFQPSVVIGLSSILEFVEKYRELNPEPCR